MMAMPTVTVVMAVHNGERFLRDAVSSILDQSLKEYEFLIIDDGSTDGSPRILQEFGMADPRIRVVSRKKCGLTRSLNEGIGMARGRYIARMDADDISLPDRLLEQTRYLDSNRDVIGVGCWVELFDDDGDVIGVWRRPISSGEIEEALLRGEGGVLVHPTWMFRTDVIATAGGYDEDFHVGQDYELLLRLSECGALANLPEVLLRYRMHPVSVSYSRSADQYESIIRALGGAYQRRGLGESRLPKPPSFVRKDLLDCYIEWAQLARSNGFLATSRKYARLAGTALGSGDDRRAVVEQLLHTRWATGVPGFLGRIRAKFLKMGTRIMGGAD